MTKKKNQYNDEIKTVWITWENQRRSLELAQEFGALLFLYDKKHKFRLIRYIYAIISTVIFLKNSRPKYVFGQNPSLVLALILVIIKPYFKFKLIIDRHSNFRYGSKNIFIDRIFFAISDFTIKYADFTIVTNENLKDVVLQNHGRGLILQDKIPEMVLAEPVKLVGNINFVFVTSFSTDEPINEVVSAFGKTKDITLYITGNYKNTKYESLANNSNENIIFTGYLHEKDFQSLLCSADALIVLTKSDNTLTCGAYEGVSLCKPLILSNTSTIKDYFNAGAVYCDPTTESIYQSILECLDNIGQLKKEICHFKERSEIEWKRRFNKLRQTIYD